MDKKARIGLIGCGWMGQHHGSNVIKNLKAELVAVADQNTEKAENFLKDNGVKVDVYGDYEKLLARDDIDAVIIASPNSQHAEHAVAAAQAGKHIYLEKPMAITLEDCRKIVDTVEEYGVKCEMGYHRRFNPISQYSKGLLQEGKLGDLVLVELDYIHHVPGDWDIWEWASKKELAGTAIHGGTGHNIDLLRYFCGEVEEVNCIKDVRMPRKVQLETEDIAVLNLRFENRAIGKAILFIGPICPFTFTLRLYGTRGTVDNNRVWLDTTPKFYEFGHEKDSITLPESWIPDNLQGGVSETWDICMDNFIDVVLGEKKPFNDAKSGFNTAAVAFAALESARDKKVVKPETI